MAGFIVIFCVQNPDKDETRCGSNFCLKRSKNDDRTVLMIDHRRPRTVLQRYVLKPAC